MWAFLHTVAWSVCNIKTGIFPHHSVPLGGYVSIGQIEASTFPPPPTQAFDTFAVPGWGIWTAPSISCEISGMASYHWGRGIRGFLWKRLFLYGQLVTRKGLKQALCCIWRYLNFNIFNIGHRLWIYECIKLCLQWNRIPVLAIQCNNKKRNRGKREWQRSITLTCHMCVN